MGLLKWFFPLALGLLCLAAVKADSGIDSSFVDSHGKCKKNGTFPLDCNTCFCIEGQPAGCTQIGCSHQQIKVTPEVQADSDTQSSMIDSDGICKKNGTFPLDCNTCLCVEGFTAGCTRKGCIDQGSVPQDSNTKSEFIDSDGICKKNGTFPLDCNTCFCIEGKHAGCTLKGCIHKRSAPQDSNSQRSFMDSDGICKEDGTFPLECNTCFCVKGKPAGCTLKGCIRKRSAPQVQADSDTQSSFVDSDGICKKNGTFPLDCNSCFCVEGKHAGCTLMACNHHGVAAQEKLAPGGKCKPGTKWKIDACNECICTHTGYASCSLNDCDTKKSRGKRATSEQKLAPGGKCEPGKRWKMDACNECVCTHTGYASCSLNDCNTKKSRGRRATTEPKISPGGRCKPGDKWKLDECNECRCTHTGYASCSLNECTSSPKKRGRRSASLSKPSGHVKMEQLHPMADI